jgi:hypothetical protein
MKPEEFAHYVDSQLHQGIPKDSLINNLRAGGWTQEQIDAAFVIHDKRVHKDLLPTHAHKYSTGEIVMVILLILFILLTCLFILGGE